MAVGPLGRIHEETMAPHRHRNPRLFIKMATTIDQNAHAGLAVLAIVILHKIVHHKMLPMELNVGHRPRPYIGGWCRERHFIKQVVGHGHVRWWNRPWPLSGSQA
jgi:hypothetical protein